MTQFKNTTLLHGVMRERNTSRLSKDTHSRPLGRVTMLAQVLALCLILAVLTSASLHALDKNIYPGCTVLSQDGRLLTIELDLDYLAGSDGCYQAIAEILCRITRDGYLVEVQNLAWVGTVDLARAEYLADGAY